MSKMATENEYVNNLFQEIEMPNENETFNENNNEKLPISKKSNQNCAMCLTIASEMMRQMGIYKLYKILLKLLKKISMVF